LLPPPPFFSFPPPDTNGIGGVPWGGGGGGGVFFFSFFFLFLFFFFPFARFRSLLSEHHVTHQKAHLRRWASSLSFPSSFLHGSTALCTPFSETCTPRESKDSYDQGISLPFPSFPLHAMIEWCEHSCKIRVQTAEIDSPFFFPFSRFTGRVS